MAPGAAGSVHATLRALQPLLGTAYSAPMNGDPLERIAARADTPVVAPCALLEPPVARPVPIADMPMVAAFLDGVQRSRVLAHVDGTPLVYATVAAAVRERRDRQLVTWGAPERRALLLASRRALGGEIWQRLGDAGVMPIDLEVPGDEGGGRREHGEPWGHAEPADPATVPVDVPWHPHALRARALALVALEREQLERRLAARWCAAESRWLWIDGGIAGNLALDASAPAFGVVKSHNTLYGDHEAVRRVLGLHEGERSPAFLVGHRLRRAVASWYLRLRTAAHGDPLFGLVRVEVVPPPALLTAEADAAARDQFSRQCDTLSSAILLERHPVSLPDARWDTLAYGVHAVESYLKAIIGP